MIKKIFAKLRYGDVSKIFPEDLLKKLGFTHPPYDSFKIAEMLGFKIDRILEFDKIKNSGSISVKNNKMILWVNRLDIKERQNFTVAHEIGHYILHILPSHAEKEFIDTPGSLYRNDGWNPVKEMEANIFAFNLLMPKKDILSKATEVN